MRARPFLIFLTVMIASSQTVLAGGTGITYPFTGAGRDVLIENPYMDESFLDFLEGNSVYALMGLDGIPLFYYSENESFDCQGTCGSISMNNYTFGSGILNLSGISPEETINSSVVVGNGDIEGLMDTINSVRANLSGSPEALAGFEEQLLEEQEGFLRSAYFENAYGDVWDYALEEIRRDPEVYGSIMRHLKAGDIGGSIGELEGFLEENFDVNEAYDISSLFSAIENRRMGQMQLDEFMRNALERISEEGGMELGDMELEEFSDLLGSEEFGEVMDRALEAAEENPELFDRLGELADEMLSRPETREVFKEAVREMMENADWESVRGLMELFNQMDNKQQLLETLMEGASEHMREMVQSGMMDEIGEQLEDPELRETLMETAQGFSKGVLEGIADWMEETPMAVAYLIAAAALVATLIILMKTRI